LAPAVQVVLQVAMVETEQHRRSLTLARRSQLARVLQARALTGIINKQIFQAMVAQTIFTAAD
jgi:hypothetical protein